MSEKPQKEKKLTAKEENFCYNYVCGEEGVRWNATQSAIKAGYSAKSSYEIGSQNLRKLDIKARISQLCIENRENREDLINRVIEERKKLAFADMKDFLDDEGNIKPLSEIENGMTKAIKKYKTVAKRTRDDSEIISVDFELHDKTANLNGLASYLGIDKTSNVTVNIYDKDKAKEIQSIFNEQISGQKDN